MIQLQYQKFYKKLAKLFHHQRKTEKIPITFIFPKKHVKIYFIEISLFFSHNNHNFYWIILRKAKKKLQEKL